MTNPAWLYCLDTCDSTNTWALGNIASLMHGAVVYTPNQTAGRGQWGRRWVSPPGVLTASYILRSLPTARFAGLSVLVGLAVVQVLQELCPELGDRLQIKWPNDVWLEDRKLAGVLVETLPHRDGVADVIVGIGLNRQVDFGASDLCRRAISLHTIAAAVPDVQKLLMHTRTELLQLAEELNRLPGDDRCLPQRWVRMINQRDLLRGKLITVAVRECEITGIGMGIDWQGQYQLRLANGAIQAINTGQILHWQ